MRNTHIHRVIWLILAIVLGCGVTIAQVRIHGKITDEKNEALEFVSVHVRGTAIGATSGLDGTY